MTTNYKIVVLVPSLNHPKGAFSYHLAQLCCAGDIANILWINDLERGPARNHLADRFLRETDGTHALWLDDDMAFSPDIATKLLAHDVDMVSGLYFGRYPPHYPIAYLKSPDPNPYLFNPLRQWTGGLEKIDACGFGAVLMKRSVLERIEPPWFINSEYAHCEDIYFCAKCRERGIDIHLDSAIELIHVGGDAMFSKADYFKHNSANLHTFLGV